MLIPLSLQLNEFNPMGDTLASVMGEWNRLYLKPDTISQGPVQANLSLALPHSPKVAVREGDNQETVVYLD